MIEGLAAKVPDVYKRQPLKALIFMIFLFSGFAMVVKSVGSPLQMPAVAAGPLTLKVSWFLLRGTIRPWASRTATVT